ncbi:MAG: TlyA family RNA methyltransferase [Planctomycetota bacterium]
MKDPDHPYVSRGGLKLEHALRSFAVEVSGLKCADLGCSTGGFTDCLLRHGAASVVCVDTAYGQLAWKLRSDERVDVRERTNALHAEPGEPADLVVLDLSWTPQRLALPAAAGWLSETGRIISLVKPHYELTDAEKGALPRGGILAEADAVRVVDRVMDETRAMGFEVLGVTRSPILGGGNRSKSKSRGNAEWLALLRGKAPPGASAPGGDQ